jgi:hypothetical protein
MTLILRYLRLLLADPIRDLWSMQDAGQPTNDLDLMVHAISRLRDTPEAEPAAGDVLLEGDGYVSVDQTTGAQQR